MATGAGGTGCGCRAAGRSSGTIGLLLGLAIIAGRRRRAPSRDDTAD
jgi:MYXO-CTERM domain-containing protein